MTSILFYLKDIRLHVFLVKLAFYLILEHNLFIFFLTLWQEYYIFRLLNMRL